MEIITTFIYYLNWFLTGVLLGLVLIYTVKLIDKIIDYFKKRF